MKLMDHQPTGAPVKLKLTDFPLIFIQFLMIQSTIIHSVCAPDEWYYYLFFYYFRARAHMFLFIFTFSMHSWIKTFKQEQKRKKKYVLFDHHISNLMFIVVLLLNYLKTCTMIPQSISSIFIKKDKKKYPMESRIFVNGILHNLCHWEKFVISSSKYCLFILFFFLSV